MLNLFYRALNNKKGFTLIEVLVVVAIIGILAALAAPRIIGRINDARLSHDVALTRTLNDAIQQHVLDEETEGGGTVNIAALTFGDLYDYLDQSTIDFLEGNVEGETAVADQTLKTFPGRFGDIVFSTDRFVAPSDD